MYKSDQNYIMKCEGVRPNILRPKKGVQSCLDKVLQPPESVTTARNTCKCIVCLNGTEVFDLSQTFEAIALTIMECQ